MPRDTYTKSLLGSDVYAKVRDTPVLVVGAGGIGCELLKNLVLVGFGNIEIIDLDTIDLSNLNRQFLFRKPDIKKSKSLVASASARHFNPSSGIRIHARHGNVKESQNDVEWIKGFGLVMNALDNKDARSHVNRLCQAGNVPLIESGTAGYLGQVTPFTKDQTECFDCETKQATHKTYPVCTLRATPSEPIHCIVWAKSYLFGKLFGEDDEAGDEQELDQAAADGENADEIANLKKEAAAFREVRQNLGDEDGPRKVFDKARPRLELSLGCGIQLTAQVFTEDINRLLAMDDLWNKEGRVKPTALDYEAIMSGSFSTPPLRTAALPAESGARVNGTANGAHAGRNGPENGESQANGDNAQLRDQRELSLRENLELFVDSCRRLSARAIAHPEIILSFDKDDDDTLDFVLATSNLRSAAYGIPQKTRFQVKEMAGNIIPAIATTNAIVAGFIVMAAIRLLSGDQGGLRRMFLKAEPSRPIASYPPSGPNRFCGVCRDVYVPLKAELARLTLGEFVTDIVQAWLATGMEGDNEEDPEWEIYEGGRLLADPDFEDLHEKTLQELDLERGKMITVLGERSDGKGVTEKLRPVHFCLCLPSPNFEKAYELPDTVPTLPVAPVKPVPRAPTPDFEIVDESAVTAKGSAGAVSADGKRLSRKRAADDDVEPQGKKRKVQVVQDDGDSDFEIL